MADDEDIDCSSMADFLKSIESSDEEDEAQDKGCQPRRVILQNADTSTEGHKAHATHQSSISQANMRPVLQAATSLTPSRRPTNSMYVRMEKLNSEPNEERDENSEATCCNEDELNLAAIRAIPKEERDPTELTSILKELDADYGKTLKREGLSGGLDGCVIENVLSPGECQALIEATERMGFTFWNVAR